MPQYVGIQIMMNYRSYGNVNNTYIPQNMEIILDLYSLGIIYLKLIVAKSYKAKRDMMSGAKMLQAIINCQKKGNTTGG